MWCGRTITNGIPRNFSSAYWKVLFGGAAAHKEYAILVVVSRWPAMPTNLSSSSRSWMGEGRTRCLLFLLKFVTTFASSQCWRSFSLTLASPNDDVAKTRQRNGGGGVGALMLGFFDVLCVCWTLIRFYYYFTFHYGKLE